MVSCDVWTLEELEQLGDLAKDCSDIIGYKLGFMLGLRYGLKKCAACKC